MLVVKAPRAGITCVNTHHPTYSEAPWGGCKQSGIGRESGSCGLEEYADVKQIDIDLAGEPMGAYRRGWNGEAGAGARGRGERTRRSPVPASPAATVSASACEPEGPRGYAALTSADE